jgi:transposase
MQSKFKNNTNDQLYLLPLSVEEFVPENHLSRLINEIVEKLDTSSIELKYSYLGQKSYHPKCLIKLWIYGYATGIYSGRKIATKCESDTAYMYLASMHKPDFRTINDFRKDNIESFNKYFVDVVKVCDQLGMVNFGVIAIDGTKIRANAAAHRSKDKEGYQKWLDRINKQIEELHKKAEEINATEDEVYGNKRGDEIPKALQKKERLKSKIEKVLAKIKDGEKINLTDEDAKIIKSHGRHQTNYNAQGSVSSNGILLTSYITTSPSDKEQLIPHLEALEKNHAVKPENILADSGYSSYDNYEWLDKNNITAYMPDQQFENMHNNAQKTYHPCNFKYDETSDCYTCPQGDILKFHHHYQNQRDKQQSRVYQTTACKTCAVRSLCTSSTYRTIHRELREHLRQQARNRLTAPEGKQLYQQRQCTIEPVWGNIKFNRKFTMFSLRGKKKVNGEFNLLSIAENTLKIFNQPVKMQVA